MAYDLTQVVRDFLYRNYGSGYKSYEDISTQINTMRELYGKQTGVRSSLNDLNKQLKLEEYSKAARYSGPTSETATRKPLRTAPLTDVEIQRQREALAAMTFNRDRYGRVPDESEKLKEWLRNRAQEDEKIKSNNERISTPNLSSKQLAKWRTGWKGYVFATGIQTGVDYGTDLILDKTDLGNTSKNLISTGANIGSSLLANKLISGKMMLPGKFGKVIQFGLPVAMSLIEMFKSDDPKKQKKIIDAVAEANPDIEQQRIADELAKLNSATNQAKQEYQAALQMGDLIDPTGPVDLNRVQGIINEAKRAKERYDVMDTIGAIYLIGGIQGGLDMMEKGKLLSSETAAKIAKLNADKESASQGNRDAMGSLKKGLDDLDAILGHNNSVIQAFSAKSQADYQNRSLGNQKMEYLMRINSGGSVKVEDPTKNIGTVVQMYNASKGKYLSLRKEKGDSDKEVMQAKRDMDTYEQLYRDMMGVESSSGGKSGGIDLAAIAAKIKQ